MEPGEHKILIFVLAMFILMLNNNNLLMFYKDIMPVCNSVLGEVT